jgi:photosynthetic reaction center cytochrome c subunit
MASLMHMKIVLSPRFGIVLALALAFASYAFAQQPAAPVLDGKTAEQVFKNIQVLQGTPASELNASMHLIKGALGVDCEYCHVEGGRDKDDKEPKKTARKMITMMMEINKTAFNGRQEVTCYTCHHGISNPLNVPTMPLTEPPPEVTEKPNLPAADQIFAKYVQALGGEQAIRKVTSRVITASQDIPTGPGGSIIMPGRSEQYFKAPNLTLYVYHTGTTTSSEGFDGSRAWVQDVRGRVADPLNIDQQRAKRSSDFYESINLQKEYAKLEVSGIEKINNRDAYLVIGTPQNDSPELLYFDTQTGLLLRKTTYLPTPVGRSPFQVDYEDYRDTGSGVKYPFLIHNAPASPRTELAPHSTIRVEKIQDNAPLEPSKFAKPQPKAAAQ